MASGGLSSSQAKKLKQEVWDDQIAYLTDELGDPSRYFPYLMSRGVLTGDDCARVKAEITNSEKVRRLVEIIKKGESKKGDPSLDVFVDAIKKQKVQAHVARTLQRAYARKKEELELQLEDERQGEQNLEADGGSIKSNSNGDIPLLSSVSSSNGGPPPPPLLLDLPTPCAESRHEIHAALGPLPHKPPKISPQPPTINGNDDDVIHSKYGPRPPSPPPSTDTTNMYPYKATTPYHADMTQMALGNPLKPSMAVPGNPTFEMGAQFDKLHLLDEEGRQQTGSQTSLLTSLSSQFSSFPSDTASEISTQLISGKFSLDFSGPLANVSSDKELVEKLIEENAQLKQNFAECTEKLKHSDMQMIEFRRQANELSLMLDKYSDYEALHMELQQEKVTNANLLLQSSAPHQQHFTKMAEENKLLLQEIDQLKQQVFNLDREKHELKIQADEFQLQRDAVIRDVNVLQMSLRPQYLPLGSRQHHQQQQQQQQQQHQQPQPQHFIMGGPPPPAPPHHDTTFQSPPIMDHQQQQLQHQPPQFISQGGGGGGGGRGPSSMVYQGDHHAQYVHPQRHSAPQNAAGFGGISDTPPQHQQHSSSSSSASHRHHHSTPLQHYHAVVGASPGIGNGQFGAMGEGGGGQQQLQFGGQSPSSMRSSNTSLSSFGGGGRLI